MKTRNIRPLVFALLALPLVFLGQPRFASATGSEMAPASGHQHMMHMHAVSAASVKKATMDYVKAESAKNKGFFVVKDSTDGKEWRLKLDKVRDPVRMFQKDGKDIYFACSDFKTADGKNILDIDLWMAAKGSKLELSEIKIHKVDDELRFTYDGIDTMTVD